MIGVVSYGMGNIQSVCNAFEHLGHPTLVVEEPGQLECADMIVIPGVGAFAAAMGRMEETGFANALGEQVLGKRKPALGICLGMQLLAEEGTEFVPCHGLGWIPGRVEPIERENTALRLPQVGWNELESVRDCALLCGISGDTSCYFVHSFELKARDRDDVAATVEYGGAVTAIVSRENIFGVQFHPEKSQRVGLKILDNFARL